MESTNGNIIEIYCDESGHELLSSDESKRKRRYFGIGAIKFNASNREQFKTELKSIKEKYNIPWEIKWRKLAPSNFEFHKALVDWFFISEIQFRLVRIDTKHLDLEFWHRSDPELGFYKFYYQCLRHILCGNYDYKIFTDFKTNHDKTRLKALQSYLNFYSSGYVQHLQALASTDSIFIQLADLFTGAVIASHNAEIASKSRQDFCAILAKKLGKTGLSFCSTRFGDAKFNIFCLEFGRTL